MKLKWTTQQRKVSELIPYDFNPRKLTPEQEQKLKESLEKFDLVEIPAINTDNTIIAGHQRVKVLFLLNRGEDKIDVRVPNRKLSDDELKEYNIRSNRNSGEWDFDILLEHFELDDLMNWGFVPEDFDGVIQQDKEKDKKEDDVPVLDKTAPTVTKLGDLIELGNHRLMCGDATNKDHIKTLMGGSKATMVWTDPPYNINYSGRGKSTKTKIMNDHMERSNFKAFLLAVFQGYQEAVTKTTPFYICHSSSSQIEFEQAMNEVGLKVKNQIIWNKKVATMGWGDYRWKHELIFYATFEGKAVPFFGDRKQYTVWDEKWNIENDLEKIIKHLKSLATKEDGSTVWTIGRESNYDHPTQKPIQLIEKALMNSSRIGELVIDFFGGSGSLMIACEKTKRNSCTMELDPFFTDIIIQRWCNYTGKSNVKINGKEVNWLKTRKQPEI